MPSFFTKYLSCTSFFVKSLLYFSVERMLSSSISTPWYGFDAACSRKFSLTNSCVALSKLYTNASFKPSLIASLKSSADISTVLSTLITVIRCGLLAKDFVVDATSAVVGVIVVLFEVVAKGVESDLAAGDEVAMVVVDAVVEEAVKADVIVDAILLVVEIDAVVVDDGT